MGNFIKYPHIDNSYQKKTLDFFLNIFPDLNQCSYTIESKLDGSNLAIVVKPNGEILYASRNQIIGDGASFYNLSETTNKYSNELSKMIDFAKSVNQICHFYVEFFGQGIQGRVNYGPEKQIRIFNIRVGDELKSPKFMYDVLEEYDLKHICIPVLGTVSGLEEALNYDPVYKSLIYPEGGSYEEGIVIKPLNRVYQTNNGDIFLLKKKNPAFLEKSKSKGQKENKISDECATLCDSFCEYINESRMFSVFSKEGKAIENKNEIGTFIKKILEDAKDDFIRDNGEYNKECEKVMFASASKIIANLLLTYMMDES